MSNPTAIEAKREGRAGSGRHEETYHDLSKGACTKHLVNLIVLLLLKGGGLGEEGFFEAERLHRGCRGVLGERTGVCWRGVQLWIRLPDVEQESRVVQVSKIERGMGDYLEGYERLSGIVAGFICCIEQGWRQTVWPRCWM